MNRDFWATVGALTCVTILCKSGNKLGYRAAADQTAGALKKIQSSKNESNNTAQEAITSPSGNPLAGTSWRLVEFQSMDDAIGKVRPDDPSLYTMRLNSDGTVAMRLNCNSASGTWSAKPSGNGSSGRFEFGPLAVTYALCLPPESGRKHRGAGQGKFDTTGNIPCAQSLGQPMVQCESGVARAGSGYATVVIMKPDGRSRAIFFRMGKPIGAETSEADGYPEFRATKEKDLHFSELVINAMRFLRQSSWAADIQFSRGRQWN
jgi:hypothetical protein